MKLVLIIFCALTAPAALSAAAGMAQLELIAKSCGIEQISSEKLDDKAIEKITLRAAASNASKFSFVIESKPDVPFFTERTFQGIDIEFVTQFTNHLYAVRASYCEALKITNVVEITRIILGRL